MRNIAVIVLALAATLGAQATQPQATIAGVVSELQTGRPLASALVRVTLDGRMVGASALTDQAGQFAIDVPSGRAQLTVTKTGFVRPRWRPGQSPQSVVIEPGARIQNVRIQLTRGGALSGTIQNERGTALPGADVRLLRCTGLDPCEPGSARQQQTATSDERGQYRFFGLPGGTYFLAADSRLGAGSSQPLLRQSADERSEASLVVSLASFYPGTTDSTQATPIVLNDGEDLAGFQILTRTGTAGIISAIVLGQDGAPLELPLSVFPYDRTLTSMGSTMLRPGPDGTQTTAPQAPGRYRVAARAGPDAWVSEVIDNRGQNVTKVRMQVQPATAVTGQVEIDPGDGAPPGDLSGFQITLRRGDLAVVVSTLDIVTATTNAAGQFVAKGLMPGRYEVICTPPPARRESVWINSVRADDVEAGDQPVTIGVTSATLKVRITRRSGGLTGSVRNERGQPVHDYAVLIFPTEPSLWKTDSRRILTTSPSSDGSFLMRELIPGEYFVALVGTHDPEALDRALLTALSQSSPRTAIKLGETTRLDLQAAIGR